MRSSLTKGKGDRQNLGFCVVGGGQRADPADGCGLGNGRRWRNIHPQVCDGPFKVSVALQVMPA